MGMAHLSTPLAWGRINSSPSPEPLRPLQGECTTRGLQVGHLAPHDHLISHTAQYRSDVRTQVLRPLLHPNTTHRTPAPSPRGPAARLQGVRLRCPGHSPEGAPHARSRRRPPRPPTPPRPSSSRPSAHEARSRPPAAGTHPGGIGVTRERGSQRGGFTYASSSPRGGRCRHRATSQDHRGWAQKRAPEIPPPTSGPSSPL